jgi:H+/Cl- antiporter ClcA
VTLGRPLILLGLLLVIAGLVLVGLEKINVPLGRLPGDLLFRRGGTVIYFPLVTCVLLSVVVSLILWLVSKR